MTELRLATTRTWQGRDGERREETLFVDVTVWDRQAENCCQYLRKGSGIHVEGSLKADTWDDKNTGEKRSKIRVTAERVQFLDSRRGDSEGGTSGGSDDDYAAPREPAARRGGAAGRSQSASTESMGSTNGPGRPDRRTPPAIAIEMGALGGVGVDRHRKSPPLGEANCA